MLHARDVAASLSGSTGCVGERVHACRAPAAAPSAACAGAAQDRGPLQAALAAAGLAPAAAAPTGGAERCGGEAASGGAGAPLLAALLAALPRALLLPGAPEAAPAEQADGAAAAAGLTAGALCLAAAAAEALLAAQRVAAAAGAPGAALARAVVARLGPQVCPVPPPRGARRLRPADEAADEAPFLPVTQRMPTCSRHRTMPCFRAGDIAQEPGLSPLLAARTGFLLVAGCGAQTFREAESPRAQAVAAAARPLAATRLPDAAAALLQFRAHQLALLVAALEALPGAAPPPGGAAEPAAAQAAAAQGAGPPGVALAPLDAALAVPALAPPGAETLALRALSCALRPGPPLAALRRAGAAALAAFAAGGSGAAAAAGCSGALAAADDPDVRAPHALTC